MLISEHQQEANRQNATHSTGPKTPEGKAAVRLNALTYGLRARSLLIRGENPAEYQQLWADLEADWRPQNRTERLQLEQMATSQWLLARMAIGEKDVYQQVMPAQTQLTLLDRISMQRARLERSFANAMHTLEHLQQKSNGRNAQRQVQPPVQAAQAVQTAQAAPPEIASPEFAPPQVRPIHYLMSQTAGDHPAFRSPIAPDSR